MRLHTALLASAAVLATGSAYAADLPSKKAAPVEYVRVCSAYGAGFFYIPGTETCIRVGGRASYEFQVAKPYVRNDATTGIASTGKIFLDARTATEYGLLRAYARLSLARVTGNIYSGSQVRRGTAFTGTSVDYRGQAQTQVNLDRAFVQFGGLTAGRTQSFFDFYGGDLEYIGTTAGSSLTTNLLAYTASFGQGFSATLSIEDAVERRQAIADGAGVGTNYYAYTGSGAPDVVANLRVEQGWGSAQLSGAVHQVRIGQYTGVYDAADNLLNFANASSNGLSPSSKYGFALNAGVQFNLPFAAGDQLWLQGTYTKGAATYIASNPFGIHNIFGSSVGALSAPLPDAFITSADGTSSKVDLMTAWGLTAAVLHYWTPAVSQGLFASYIKADVPGSIYAAAGGATPGNMLRDWSYWTVGTNVTWSPVKDLSIGGEVAYVQQKMGGGKIYTGLATDNPNRVLSSDSAIATRIKIQRDF